MVDIPSTARSQCEVSNIEVDISEIALNVKELAVSVRTMKTLLFLCLCSVLFYVSYEIEQGIVQTVVAA